jgi:6-phosphogluconolactonase
MTTRLFLGAYASSPEHGISLAHFDTTTGEIAIRGILAAAPNPSFLAVHSSGRFVYAIHDRNPGQVAAYRFDPETEKLTLINLGNTLSPGPTHLCLDAKRQRLVVANYAGGSVSIFPILSDGALGECSSVVLHSGNGSHPKRQEAPHAHGVYISPEGGHVLCVDLGVDKIYVYRLDRNRIIPHEPAYAETKAGAGPRHGTFSPCGRRFYVINELDNTVTGFHWNGEAGTLQAFCTIPTLPADFQGENLTAELEFHPSGKYLYGSNRGHDSLVRYAAAEDGTLSLLGHTLIGAAEPRHFKVSPDGAWLVTADQKANQLSSFKIDPASGELTKVNTSGETQQPVCVLFAV